MAESDRFEMRVDPEWVVRVDRARGVLTRAAFIKGATERVLDQLEAWHPNGAPAGTVPVFSRPATSDASRSRPAPPAPDPDAVEDAPPAAVPAIAKRHWA